MAELLKIATISTWLFVIIDNTKDEDKASHISHLILLLGWLYSTVNGGSGTPSVPLGRISPDIWEENCWVIVYFISAVPPSYPARLGCIKMKFIPTTIPDLRPLVLQDLHRYDERDSPHSYELGCPLQGSVFSIIYQAGPIDLDFEDQVGAASSLMP